MKNLETLNRVRHLTNKELTNTNGGLGKVCREINEKIAEMMEIIRSQNQ